MSLSLVCLIIVLVYSIWITAIFENLYQLVFGPISFSFSLDFISSFDFVTWFYFWMLLICAVLALIFSFKYYNESPLGFHLFYMMLGFVYIMVVVVSSGNLLLTLVAWEYLGLMSFFLILFYGNRNSARASLVTLFCSRFGDVALFAVFVYYINIYSLASIFYFFFLLIVLTKSASYPFISWLLEAMRAPTPVSALVHSSTLVAAGVWFLVRYGGSVPANVMFVLFNLAILTIVITGISALSFLDLKKIVALSTCNNIAWCLLYFTVGDFGLVLVQLLVHGVCKCVLFILVGDLMKSNGDSQSLVGLYPVRNVGAYHASLVMIVMLSLCGIPFLGLYFSKHYFFTLLICHVYNIPAVIYVGFGIMFSFAYSFRLTLIVFKGGLGMSLGHLGAYMFASDYVIIGAAIGCVLQMFNTEICEMSVSWSLVLVAYQILGCLFGYNYYLEQSSLSHLNSNLWGSDYWINSLYNLYNFLKDLVVVCLVRWELEVLSSLQCLVVRGNCSSLFLVSINVFVVGLIFYIVVSFVLSS